MPFKNNGTKAGIWIAAVMAAAGLSGCATTRPVAYSGLVSSDRLRPNPDDRTGRIPFRYASDANWRRYHRLIVEPVAIYSGTDAQFGKLPDEARQYLAHYMQEEFTRVLGQGFEIVERPDRDTLRLQLTLTGAKATTPVLGTFSRFDLAGGPYNAVQGVRGREGTLTGSVTYAIELYDGSTNRLLGAQITRQFPSAMNIGASFGAMKASKVAIRKGAKELAEQLRGCCTE